MRSYTSSFALASIALLAATSVACGQSSSTSSSAGDSAQGQSPAPKEQGAAERAISEADIIQLDDARLYAMSKSGSVSVVDVATPGRLALLGKTRLAGEPFEMYRRGNFLVTMSNDATSATGTPETPAAEGTTPERDPNGGAAVIVVDVENPSLLRTIATFSVPGAIADSRVVGDILYLATYENAACFKCGKAPRTMVTSFDVSDPQAIHQVDQVAFESNAPDGYNLPWGSNWKRSIFATSERLYIGGHADISPSDLQHTTSEEGIVDVIDVTDPGGHLGTGARLTVAGALLSRWQIDERDGVLRIVSQKGAGRTANGIGMPEVETFRIDSTSSFVPLGKTTLKLPMQEGLRTVRFDTDRAYAITYNQTDPLFTIDLRDPAHPQQMGALEMPGFMFHLEPRGDRLVGLGVDRTDTKGSLNISLFDVSDLSHPRMLQRVAFGAPSVGEDYAILNYELPEDQDRIQKSLRLFDDGLIAMPFTSAALSYSGSGDACDSVKSGVQLVQWSNDTLTKGALLPVRGNPRRAFRRDGEMIAVSDSNVTSFSLPRFDAAKQTADLTIGTCVARSIPNQGYNPNDMNEGGGDYYGRGHYGCSAAPGTPGTSSDGRWATFGLGLAAVALAVGRRRRDRRPATES
jgi:MYXO-CTERM domain-containing protein